MSSGPSCIICSTGVGTVYDPPYNISPSNCLVTQFNVCHHKYPAWIWCCDQPAVHFLCIGSCLAKNQWPVGVCAIQQSSHQGIHASMWVDCHWTQHYHFCQELTYHRLSFSDYFGFSFVLLSLISFYFSPFHKCVSTAVVPYCITFVNVKTGA